VVCIFCSNVINLNWDTGVGEPVQKAVDSLPRVTLDTDKVKLSAFLLVDVKKPVKPSQLNLASKPLAGKINWQPTNPGLPGKMVIKTVHVCVCGINLNILFMVEVYIS